MYKTIGNNLTLPYIPERLPNPNPNPITYPNPNLNLKLNLNPNEMHRVK